MSGALESQIVVAPGSASSSGALDELGIGPWGWTGAQRHDAEQWP